MPATRPRSTRPTRRLATALAALVLLAGAATARADFIVGGTGNDNLFPFGTSSYYSGEYQQLYASSAFGTSPFTINSIGFESIKILNPGSETLTFSVGLSTTSASLSAPSTTYASNKGADFTTVFNGSITFTGQNNGTFDLVVPTAPFTYDPSKGNLLLDVVMQSSSGPGIASFTFGPDPQVTRIYNIGGISTFPTVGVGEGLLTLFQGASTVPEPSAAVALIAGGGLTLVGCRRRARRR